MKMVIILCLVEIKRHSNAYDVIEGIMRDTSKVDNDFMDVMFKAYENKTSQPLQKIILNMQ